MIAKAVKNTLNLKSIRGRFIENSVIYKNVDRPSHVFSLAISKRIELESWDWSQIEDILM